MGSGGSIQHAMDNTVFDLAILKKKIRKLPKSVRDGRTGYGPRSFLMHLIFKVLYSVINKPTFVHK